MSLMYPFKRLFTISTVLLFGLFLPACSKPESDSGGELVVSVRPLALIAREITGEDIPVRVLVEGADPHHYAPSVSDRAALERALLLVWLGPQMEGVLAKQAALLPAGRQMQLLDIETLEYKGASATDPHLWLRPRNAAIAAAQIAERLAQLQPQQAELFMGRARQFSSAMANLQKVIDRALYGYREVPIVVTHDAYGHFFGSAGVKTHALGDGSGGGYGAKAMLDLSQIGDGCLFGDMPANERDQQLAENLGLRYAALDLLGDQLNENADYRELIESLLSQARTCLSQVPDRSKDKSEAP
ncbi:metal ABC transporter substrate-binding protein [Microbulbifer sp. TRSA007]|uniref:metal ABC transporter substrate-binding protein n=1 Tax=Microbulbifer sp. TRSA007 TaxID=3243384 RepID=UPI004039A602